MKRQNKCVSKTHIRHTEEELKLRASIKGNISVADCRPLSTRLSGSKWCLRQAPKSGSQPPVTLTFDLLTPTVVCSCTEIVSFVSKSLSYVNKLVTDRRTDERTDERSTRGQSNWTKSASREDNSPVRGHPRGSKVVPLNSWGRVSY